MGRKIRKKKVERRNHNPLKSTTTMKKGKIACCPLVIREEVNRRLLDGQCGADVMEWLNADPEVRKVLKAQFKDRPIEESNLKGWRKAGYRDWLKQKQRMEE